MIITCCVYLFVNRMDDTPLHDCARSGHPAVAKLLLDAGASLSSVNNVSTKCVYIVRL